MVSRSIEVVSIRIRPPQIVATHARGETPFLHVFTTNHTAVALYRRLGFEQRHEMHLTVLDREQK